MTEEFLSYLWRFRMLNPDLYSTSGELISVLNPGELNTDSGPDYLHAKIRIDDTLWVGNVELHINSGDWFRHHHHMDQAYNNVILHVVFQDDGNAISMSGRPVPTVVVNGQFETQIYDRYHCFLNNRSWIPCQQLISRCDTADADRWFPALTAERLMEKNDQLRKLLQLNNHDWEETFYQGLSKAFGLKINTLPFEFLAKSLPLKVILRYEQNTFGLEALAFGQSGMLTRECRDEYPVLLKREYEFLLHKHELKPIEPSAWKFLRLRPSAFPTLRISQWAVFLQQISTFFSFIVSCPDLKEIRKRLSVKAPEYWDQHYLFDRLSTYKPKILGPAAVDLIILNFIIPFLFFYGEEKNQENLKEHGLHLLENIKGESNSIINHWKSLGIQVRNALQTQGLMQLKTRYCDQKRCLSCRIGLKLIRG